MQAVEVRTTSKSRATAAARSGVLQVAASVPQLTLYCSNRPQHRLPLLTPQNVLSWKSCLKMSLLAMRAEREVLRASPPILLTCH